MSAPADVFRWQQIVGLREYEDAPVDQHPAAGLAALREMLMQRDLAAADEPGAVTLTLRFGHVGPAVDGQAPLLRVEDVEGAPPPWCNAVVLEWAVKLA